MPTPVAVPLLVSFGSMTCAVILHAPWRAKFVASWNAMSKPYEELVASSVDVILLACLSPLLVPMTMVAGKTLWSAIKDLDKLTLWQKAIFWPLVLVALGLAMAEGPVHDMGTWILGVGKFKPGPVRLFATGKWLLIRDPIQKVFIGYADYIVAVCAMCVFAPLALILLVNFGRAVWGCRIKISGSDAAKA